MNKKMILASTVLTLSLLTACGKTDTGKTNHGSGHGANHNQEATEQTNTNKEAKDGTHEGHGDSNGNEADKTSATANLNALFTFEDSVKANEETKMNIQITNEDGTPVNEYKVNHEKLLHLIIVDHELSYFSHIHPEFQENGTFTVNTTFPSGGEFKVFADFIPKGGSNITLSKWINVEGKESPHSGIKADATLVKEIDGKEIELIMSGDKSNEETTLSFNIRDAKTKEGINNLEPYLGAVGHVVILSKDAEKYLHVHPLEEKATGPEAKFETSFPKSGIYKIWGQFQHEGKVFTVPFTVDVK